MVTDKQIDARAHGFHCAAVRRLAEGPATTAEISVLCDSMRGARTAMATLQRWGLMTTTVERCEGGRVVICRLTERGRKTAERWADLRLARGAAA